MFGMKKILLLLMLSIFLVSCGSSRPSAFVHDRGAGNTQVVSKPTHKKLPSRKQFNSRPSSNKDTPVLQKNNSDIDIYDESFLKKLEMIDYAKSFQGTRYKFGGMSSSGMDCSGLVCTVFQKEEIELPRISRDMATEGSPISLNQVEPGDLIFFKTSSRQVINHVGLVVESDEGGIKFIHSTVQRGVIISSLEENYWKRAFVEARRVI